MFFTLGIWMNRGAELAGLDFVYEKIAQIDLVKREMKVMT